ncbi:PREDICTED: hemocyte protein-glutamine gamma-glutamyltransferase-like [Priapulus caudatus]|uniref:Hemocyte protein-glutamine gamma-glutamyltransferase-like n=1 Tax=Priapulus caudatus TaxID=37621 RepID=A0ABM1ETH8_PRICU|nr:PREDICTED: hemocyte protein-glutamine gamma-glutamyltransferase-like [Priapulus caudatus]
MPRRERLSIGRKPAGTVDAAAAAVAAKQVVSGEDSSIPAVLTVEWETKTNGTGHHTYQYNAVQEDNRPVVRRGQPFTLKITTDQKFERKKNVMRLRFDIGPKPKNAVRTRMLIHLRKPNAPDLGNKEWSAKVLFADGNTQTIEVMPAANCPVGRWKLSVITESKATKKTRVFNEKESVCILFNPWCKDDQAYMASDEEKEEYVLNDLGKIWCGSAKRMRYRVWNFGQFEDMILDAALRVVEESGLDPSMWGNAAQVIRSISAMVNDVDDNGVLAGNWSGEYMGGTAPTEWQGSVQILQQWFTTKEAVMYGQCWVFSGVSTSVMRALGIPCRSVTNFASAHDSNMNITVDVHFNEELDTIEEMNVDSIWNFHVWNEAWMARPDLPKGYGGWQALDATPQEASDGVYRAGPASVAAIRRGEVGQMYDAPFIFAEVNADVVHWIYKGENCPMVKLRSYGQVVGKLISTKRPGPLTDNHDDRMDLTDSYKPKDRSPEEIHAFLNALQCVDSSSLQAYGGGQDVEDVEFTLEDRDDVLIGSNFSHVLKLKNTSSKVRTVEVNLHINTTFYTGVVAYKVKTEKTSVTIKPNSTAEAAISVTADDYLDLLVDQASFQVFACAKVKETNQIYSAEDDFRVRAPNVSVEAIGPFKAGKPIKLDFWLDNPLPRTLTNCYFIIEGPGIAKPVKLPCSNMQPKGGTAMSYACTPKKPGNKAILVSFSSKQLKDADGFLKLQVEK